MSADTPNSLNQSTAPASSAPLVAPALRRRLQQCFEHAKKLMALPKYDFDYANTLLQECICSDPSTAQYVDAYLENLGKKYDNNLKGAKLQLFLNRGGVKKAALKKDWMEVIRQGAEVLKIAPWDAPTLHAMAEACENLGCSETELRYLKMALMGNAKDVDVNRHCARSLARMGQFDQAIACWARVSEIKKDDQEAQKMIGDLQIEKTRWKFGMVTAEERKKVLHGGATPQALAATAGRENPQKQAPPPAPVEEAPKKREVQLTAWQKLENEIRQDPGNVEKYIELSSVYAEEGKLAEAERTLHKAQPLAAGDLRIQERLEELQILRARQQAMIAEKRAQVESTDSAKELAKQMKDNLNRVELQIYSQRSERYPTEHRWKYEVGTRLKRAGNYGEALQLLKSFPTDDERAAAALIEAGECLQHVRQFPKALETYRKAADLAALRGNIEYHKLALYRAGVLAIAMNDPAGPEILATLIAIDPVYRDTKERYTKATTKPSSSKPG